MLWSFFLNKWWSTHTVNFVVSWCSTIFFYSSCFLLSPEMSLQYCSRVPWIDLCKIVVQKLRTTTAPLHLQHFFFISLVGNMSGASYGALATWLLPAWANQHKTFPINIPLNIDLTFNQSHQTTMLNQISMSTKHQCVNLTLHFYIL